MEVVYRAREGRPVGGERAASIAEQVARGRTPVRYDTRNRVVGGGYNMAGAIGSLVIGRGDRYAFRAPPPPYVQNILDFYHGVTNRRDWAFCSMFVAGCYEAACRLEAREDLSMGRDPKGVSPHEYEHFLNRNPQFEQVGRFRYDHHSDVDLDLQVQHREVFDVIKHAVETYRKTLFGTFKVALGVRKVSPESQIALDDLTRQIALCGGLRRAPADSTRRSKRSI